MSTTPRSREAISSTRLSTSAPLSRPPAIHTTESKERMAAAAACGLVALESLTKRTPRTVAISAMRCRSGRKARSPSRTAMGPTP